MELWTTFCPQKVYWELSVIKNQGKSGKSDWQKEIPVIKNSLHILKENGISGIRLVIFPTELTQDGITFHWESVSTVLSLCEELKLKVIFCIGPFQYPHYPGVYLPKNLLNEISKNLTYIDQNPVLNEFGLRFLKEQLLLFGFDKRITGFHLGNEWPDRQRVSDKEMFAVKITEDFMLKAIEFLVTKTDKPVFLNTNIDAADKSRLNHAFQNVLEKVGKQGRLGFDIYPSQETWKKAPLQKIRRLFEPYYKSYRWSCNLFDPCEIYFAEIEAQPWGAGQSWFQLIKEANNPYEKVLSYTKDSLRQTGEKYIFRTNCRIISLWGSDFWLSAHALGINWPLEAVKNIKSHN